MTQVTLTENTKNLFVFFAKEQESNGVIWIELNKQQRGNLTSLKRNKLVETHDWEPGETYLTFTQKGIDFGKTLGFDLVESGS